MNPAPVRRSGERLLPGLTDMQRQVLDLRWGLSGTPPCTQPAGGVALGIPATRVCSLELGALRHLQKLQHPPPGALLSACAQADLACYGRMVAPGAVPARAADPQRAGEWIAWLRLLLTPAQADGGVDDAEVEAVYDRLLADCFGPRMVIALLCPPGGKRDPAPLALAEVCARAAAQRPSPGWIRMAPTVWCREPCWSGGLAVEVWRAAGPRSGYTIVVKPRVVPHGGHEAPAVLQRSPGPLAEALRQAEIIAAGPRAPMPDLRPAPYAAGQPPVVPGHRLVRPAEVWTIGPAPTSGSML